MAARVVFMPVLAQLAPPLPHPAARLSHSPTPASRPLTLCPASAQQVPTWRCCLPLGAFGPRSRSCGEGKRDTGLPRCLRVRRDKAGKRFPWGEITCLAYFTIVDPKDKDDYLLQGIWKVQKRSRRRREVDPTSPPGAAAPRWLPRALRGPRRRVSAPFTL